MIQFLGQSRCGKHQQASALEYCYLPDLVYNNVLVGGLALHLGCDVNDG